MAGPRRDWAVATPKSKAERGEEGASPPAPPQLTEHEHGTMAHHGGAMQSPVPRAEESGRSFWRRSLREAQKTLPPQGLHLNPLPSGSPPITAPTSLTGTKMGQLTFSTPPPTQERRGKLGRERAMLEVESTGACAIRRPLPAACGAILGASAEARALGSHATAHVCQLQGGCWVGLRFSMHNAGRSLDWLAAQLLSGREGRERRDSFQSFAPA